MEVAEDVMQMCREIIPDLDVPPFLDIEDPDRLSEYGNLTA